MRTNLGTNSALPWVLTLAGTIGFSSFAVAGPMPDCGSGAGNIKDEAMCVGRGPDSLPGSDVDYFRDMDYGATKDPAALARDLPPYLPGVTPEQALKAAVIGRNNWIVWTGGNDRLWDVINRSSVGELDFLKTLSSHPSRPNLHRSKRWSWLGLVNEPCFTAPTGPQADRFGLWLDVRDPNCPADPFEDATKYPGVQIGARGRSAKFPVGSYYGYATGVVGLRLFPNPAFDEEAEKKWDAEKFYNDPAYYNNKDLVRPYRVGMSCAFCHVGPNPTNPPADPANPKWENLNSNPGAQYFWWDRVFTYTADPSDFFYQYFHQSRPGALDTSLLSTDYIANPRTMNAVYNFGARLRNALRLGGEQLTGGERNNKQLNEYVPPGTPLTKYYTPPGQVWTPRILKDGSDSAGALGSLNRVYVNIGLFSEEWLEHFNPIVGGRPITAITIATGRKNSSYWLANERQTPNLALFFLMTAKPDYLKNAPGGAGYLNADAATMNRGKEVFSERCARCHSSKLPEKAYSFFPDTGCTGSNYLQCWNNYWAWTKTDEYKRSIKSIVTADDFLDRQLPVDRSARSRDFARDQCVQSARNQCHQRQHLERLLVDVVQGVAGCRSDHGPSSDHRGCARLRHAGWGAWVYASRLADQPLVDRAVPAQQFDRPVRGKSVGRKPIEIVRRLDRADAVAGEAPRQHRPRDGLWEDVEGAGRRDHGDQLSASSPGISARPLPDKPSRCIDRQVAPRPFLR